MKTRIQKTDFDFRPSGHGIYRVTYTSPATGKQWTAKITDMELVDMVRNTPEPRVCDLERLKYHCKNH